MGYLTEGDTLKWPASLLYLQYIKTEGIKQFLKVYNNLKQNKECNFMFGDEIEYSMFVIDNQNKTISVSLRAHEIIQQLSGSELFIWHTEYSNYMVEGTPAQPYNCSTEHLIKIYPDLVKRRQEIKALLKDNEIITTMTAFPRLGCIGSSPLSNGNEPFSQSDYLSDEVIGKHLRFTTLTENIRLRRGSKVNIKVPIYKDKNTDSELNFIHMDCMCFGMGCSCLQQTFQAKNENDARYLYDQLAVIAPILLAITAASPAYRGYLANVDCRWDIIAKSVDDRNEEEIKTIAKSRYGSISFYVSDNEYFKSQYNDLSFEADPVIEKLLDDEVDPLLAQHLNYAFIRDPLVIYRNGLPVETISWENVKEGESLDKYENIHSTNWNTVRLKIPVPNICGWRVEFRPMELQKDDYSNASFLVFMSILVRAILYYRPNWYIPISMLDQNMDKAQKRNAVLSEKFFFKKTTDDNIILMTIDEVVNGQNGLMSYVTKYMSEIKMIDDQRQTINGHIDLIRQRANGSIKTDAALMREFIINHPKYQKDSIVSNEICFDLIKKMGFIQ